MILCPQLRRLAGDHARWRAALGREEAATWAGRADRLLALWDGEVAPHCRAEEEVLLPELARHLGEAEASIVFTLGDHVALRQLVRELRAGSAAARVAAASKLALKLLEHLDFEERTLFPTLQQTLGCTRFSELAPELAAHLTTHHQKGSTP